MILCRLTAPEPLTRISLSGELPSVAEHSAEPDQKSSPMVPEQATHRNAPEQARRGDRGDRSVASEGEPIRERELSLRERYAVGQTGGSGGDGLIERAALMKTETAVQLPGAGR